MKAFIFYYLIILVENFIYIRFIHICKFCLIMNRRPYVAHENYSYLKTFRTSNMKCPFEKTYELLTDVPNEI